MLPERSADLTRAAKGPAGTSGARWPAVCLLLGLVVVVGGWLHSFSEPLDRDQACYLACAHELRSGKLLYRDCWDHKPPAIFCTLALLEPLVGPGAAGLKLIWLVLAFSAVLLTRQVLLASTRSTWAAGQGALLYGLVCTCPGLQANDTNTEPFMVLPALLSLLWMLRWQEDRRAWRLWGIGALMAVSSLFKHVAVFQALAFLACALVLERRAGWRRMFHAAAALCVPGVLAWSLVTVYFWSKGALDDFLYCVFTYNRGYVSGSLRRTVSAFPGIVQKDLPGAMKDTVFLWLAAASSAVFLLRHRRQEHSRALVLAFAAGSALAVVAPGNLWPHYFILALPAAVVLAVLGWFDSRDEPAGPSRREAARWRHAGALLMSAAVLWSGIAYAVFLRKPVEVISSEKYTPIFLRCRNLGLELGRLSRFSDTLYNWGSEVSLYVYAERAPATRFLYNFPLIAGRDPAFEEAGIAEVARDLRSRRPRIVVTTWPRELPDDLQRVLDDQYREVHAGPWYRLFELRTDPLPARDWKAFDAANWP